MEAENIEVDSWGQPFGGIPYNGHPCLLAKSPKEYLYMKFLRFFLRAVGGWPMKLLKEKELIIEGKYFGHYLTALAVTCLISQLLYLIENGSKLGFFVLGHMCISLLLNMVCASRCTHLVLLKRSKLLAARFLTEFHVLFHKDKSDYSRLIFYKVHRVSKWFTAYQILSFVAAWLLYNLVPVYLNYVNGKFNTPDGPANSTYELSVFLKLPIDPERNFKSYCMVFVINCYTSFLCGDAISIFDTLLSLMIFNLWGHFKILLHHLVTFPRPAASYDKSNSYLKRQAALFSHEEQKIVSNMLQEYIEYHRYLINFANEVSQCFGFVLFFYFTFHQVSGCVLLLECSQGPESLARYLPLTVMMTFQLIQISIIFETIGSVSEKVRDEVYSLPWEHMNKKNRKTVILFLINVQKPVHIKAGGLVNVGVATMARILKTTLSFYAFLRTMSN